MYLNSEDLVIPKYAFVPDPVVGNQVFRINKNDKAINYIRSDFLVPHRKDYYFMAFVKKGKSRHWIDMTPYTLKPDTFYFTIPNQVHLKEDAEPLTGITLSFSHDFLVLENNEALKELPILLNPHNQHELTLSPQNLAFLEDLLEKIHAEFHAKASWQHSMLSAYVKILLVYVSRLYNEQFSDQASVPDRVLLKSFLAKIDEFYASRHEVAAYADLLHLSAGHLSELVKEQSGKPAIAHIHERLILEAKRLLFHTDHAIKEIAFQLGFEDASYFNRFFKRLTTHTPAYYRSHIREMYH